ncbi:MAG: diaminopimelate decarboxylase [Chloroflexota bacterium]|nr:diaminopimelate decarboxylase [Chloroflexota bacterium]
MTAAPDTDRLPEIAAALRQVAGRFGTPAYVTDVPALDAAAAAVRAAFPDPWLRHYSVKANDVAAVVRLVGERGFGANVVSRGEWQVARRAGLANERITLEGIGKTDADLRAAANAARERRPLGWIAIESVDEAATLARIAGRSPGARLDVLFRLNPDVAPETHRGLAVGAGGSKFGMTETELATAVEAVRSTAGLRARGIHVHVGSQLGAVDAWRDAVRRGLALLALLRGTLPDFDTFDMGGGFPVAPVGEAAPDPARFAREVGPLLEAIPEDRRPRRLAIEPGRYLVARAGWLVARVLHVRDRGGRQVVIDAGMTELIRPALYGAHHGIVALTSLGLSYETADPRRLAEEPARVEGPLCESTDALGEHPLPAVRRGDLVAIRDAGAYGASFASTYNGRPRPPQVLFASDGTLTLARRRGSLGSLG